MLTLNPYTGVPLAQEPAVAMIEIQNEDSYLFWTFKRGSIPEAQMNALEVIYNDFLIAKYGAIDKALENWDNYKYEHDTNNRIALMDIWFLTTDAHTSDGIKKRASDQLRFLTEHQKEFYEAMTNYYKTTIGTPILITASNWTTAEPRTMEALERYTYTAADVIDRHGYFEEGHTGKTASYRVMPKDTYVDISATLNPSKAIMQSNAIKNYPFIVTETAWPRPNRYYGEAVPMWSLYGALQGVDGIFMFVLGHLPWEENVTAKWPIATPSVIGQFPAFALMYRQGYIKEADIVVDATHNIDDLYKYEGADIYESLALDNLRK